MGTACGTQGKEEECNSGFWWEKPKKRNSLEDLSVGERIIVKYT